ncbi:rho guanine nucleotide exchange factor 15 [Austrofundulus limnaeus]|uniref:Rho guanine nucleotide exchange factor 15 n=1 Tax=Austrofundulus limnaeus TaxID=52670 RepID=A0A2I4C4N5_AUSLI|nr:PREDICTED: rho guanine nucleotide exchange factor 15-like [Austrofundulus limnaeus]
MSKQEQGTSLVKPEVKQRPEVSFRSLVQSSSGSPADRDNASEPSEGKVKDMVNMFRQQESKELEEHATICLSEPLTGSKKPPAVKPKPGRVSSSPQPKPEELPPLPKKRSRVPNKQNRSVEGVEPKGASAGGRSEPDGKEVEAEETGGGEAEASLASCSGQSCSCLCHLQRPGMMLIWVPVDVESAGEENNHVKRQTPKNGKRSEEAEQGGKVDGKAKDEAESASVKEKPGTKSNVPDYQDCLPSKEEASSPPVKEKHGTKQKKSNFHAQLNGLLANHHSQRISEPGSQATNIYESSLIKPAPSLPALREPTSQDEEENIYEVHLPVPEDFPKKTIVISDLLRFSESNASASNAAPAVVVDKLGPDDTPPARPPKTHMLAGNLPPCRPAPPPPLSPSSKREPRKLSNVSLNQTGEENGGMEEREDKEPRKFSFKLESHLQNEPLYQMYRKTVISKEIHRQTVNRNTSKGSYDYPLDWMANRNRKGSDASAFSEDGNSSTLWQELPEVRESGVLEQLSAKDIKYQESMFEVLTSEASYLRSLRILTELFVESRELNETLVIMDKKTLFSNILKVREVSERFLKDLEDHIFKDIVFTDICGIIHYHAQHNFPAYIDYVRNQIYQEKTFTELKKINTQFANVIKHLQESPQCQRLPFVSFLLLPFQRITRIKMLIENILKRTKQGTKEEQEAIKALDSVSKIIDKCNTEVGKMRQVEELVHLSNMLDFDNKVKAIPIISETRFLEKKGELLEMSRGKTIVNMRMKFSPVNLFLFNDLLVIAVKKSGERFMVADYAHRSLVQVQPNAEDSVYENSFVLVILENHQGRAIERFLKAPSKSDKQRWLAAFPDSTTQDDEEKVYEDFDCPQVQCVEQYDAEQADELSLEPAEIVNVIRKTNEGWYEGSRLSDGQKGWFPVANVIEITNEHVRRRNLLERYRVSQAASFLSKTR